MIHLILNYKSKIESLRRDTIKSLQKEQNETTRDLFFILTGKLLAYDSCIKEIERLIQFIDLCEKP